GRGPALVAVGRRPGRVTHRAVRHPAGTGGCRQPQDAAASGTSRDDVPVAAPAVPASTDPARVANDWYAALPGSTPTTVRSPCGVRSVMSTASSPPLRAVTATYALPARQRVTASTSTSTSSGP